MAGFSRLLSVSAVRLSGGSAKPKWGIDRQHLFGAARGDRHHYGEHPTYNHFLLFVRGLRPAVESAAAATAKVLADAGRAAFVPVRELVKRHNPDLRLQLVALTSFAATSMAITGYFNSTYQKIIDLTSLLEHRAAEEYEREGFWRTAEQERERRQQLVQQQQQQLQRSWLASLAAATEAKDFSVLCDALDSHAAPPAAAEAGEGDSYKPLEIEPPLSWRFELMPYGADCEDAHTFPTPSYEMPLRAFSLSFTSNNLSGNWGDYMNRQDNKNAIMRPSRVMFTDVFIPTTKKALGPLKQPAAARGPSGPLLREPPPLTAIGTRLLLLGGPPEALFKLHGGVRSPRTP
ncbi:hypothetical protein Efla_007419 [Eimeria flavescens]